MNTTINVTAVLIANAMGIAILICVVLGNVFLIREQVRRNKYLLLLTIVTICSCILDSIWAVTDGVNGVAVMISNTLVYLCGPITAILWILIVAKYIKIRISRLHKIIICSFGLVSVGLIIANLFVPILFRVNEYNIYERVDGLYMIYTACYFGLLADVVIMYVLKKLESGGIKFFPMWTFIIPMAIGMLIQNIFFGVSTIGPFIAISITAIVISFQNSLLFKDQLTDLYNRYYLAVLEKRLLKKHGKEYSVIMLDINGFKGINDVYGHDAGDEALVNLSRVLVSVVDKSGEVIRYAGDEFIIIVHSRDDEATEKLISRIHQSLKEFVETKTVPYDLSVSVGWCRFSMERTLNEFITEADKHMYHNKQEYYKSQTKLGGNAE